MFIRVRYILIAFLIIPMGLRAQAQEELPQSEVYGELSKYQLWPLSATAFSGDDLSMMSRVKDQELADLIPNHYKTDTGIGSFGDVSSMRGLTNTPFFSAPSVVQYIDGVPSGNTFSHTPALFGVDSIEVLRGAQGTLFGVNSYGGVINIKSRRPSEKPQATLINSVGSYSSFLTNGVFLTPLTPDNTLSLRFGVQKLERDGVLENNFLGTAPDFIDQTSLSGALYWNPSDRLELSFSATSEDYDNGASRLTLLSGNPYELNSNIPGSSQQASDSQAFTVDYKGSDVNVLSVTSARQWQIAPYSFDLDFGPFPGNRSNIFLQQDVFSQELRFSSAGERKLEWAFGAYFGKTDVSGSTERNFLVPIPLFFGGGFAPILTTTDYDLDEDAAALFGQLSYNGIDGIGIHFGLRADQFEKTIRRNAVGLSGPVPEIALDEDFSFLSPRVGLDFEVGNESLLYVNAGISHKPGGFSAFVDDPLLAGFDEERAVTKELGLKKKWLDDAFRTNIAFFHNDIDDYQVERSLIATDYAVFNADEATSYGAEIEISAEIMKGLRLQGSLGRTKTELSSYIDPVDGTDLSGNQAPFVPELDASLSATYTHESGFFAQIELLHRGEIYFDDRNIAPFSDDDYNLVNAAVGYLFDSGLEVSLFGSNLTEEVYYLNMTPDLNAGTVGLPKIVGIRARWDY
jgi:iron complex outermembrane receptor protein